MPPLVVDATALDGAGASMVSVGDALAAAIETLTLIFGANTGQDAAGVLFARAYQTGAKDALTAAATAVNDSRRIGFLIEMSAVNYSRAEAASTLGGGTPVVPLPPEPGPFDAPGAPSTLGPGVGEPTLWPLVEVFVCSVWPNGDPVALRAAADSWRSLAAVFEAVNEWLAQPQSAIGEQVMPEGGHITAALTGLGVKCATVTDKCEHLGQELDGFADDVQRTQDAIRDLLHRLATPSGWWHEIVTVLEGDALKDITEAARDIRAVLDNMKREADARRGVLQLGLGWLDSAVVAIEGWGRKELTHFLGEEVGNPLATVFDTFVNVNEGVFKDAVGMEQGLEQMAEPKLLLDPDGGADEARNLFKTGALWYLVDAREAAEADHAVVKQLLHLDDWRRDRPGLGAGENLLDIATLFIPGGGEANAGVRGAEGAAAASRGLAKVGDLGRATGAMGGMGKTASDITRSLDGLGRDVAKTAVPAPGGRPAALPPAKPGEPPAGAPHGPVEPKPPAEPPAAEPGGAGDSGAGAGGRPSGPSPADAGTSGPLAGLKPGSFPDSRVPPPLAATHAPQWHPPYAPPPPMSKPLPEGQPLSPPLDGGLPSAHPSDTSLIGDGASHSSGSGHSYLESDHEHPLTGALTADDLLALADYTDNGYEDLNGALRSGTVNGSQQARIEALNTALEKLPHYEGIVVRGTDLSPRVLAEYEAGMIVTEDGFTSTTTSRAVATEFGDNVLFKVFSVTGRDISSMSVLPHEQEVLFPSGSRFYVVSKTVDPLTGKTVIEMIDLGR